MRKLAFKELSYRRRAYVKAMISTILLSLLATVAFVVVRTGQTSNKSTLMDYMEVNRIEVKSAFAGSDSLEKKTYFWECLLAEEGMELLADERLEYAALEYTVPYSEIQGNASAHLSDIALIDIYSFYENKIRAQGLVGDFPTKENEVILAADAAKTAFETDDYEEILGQEFTFVGYDRTFTVVGIQTKADIYGTMYTYLCRDAAYEMLQQAIYEMEFANIYTDEYFAQHTEFFIEGSGWDFETLPGVWTDLSKLEGREVMGELPQEPGEVVLSSGVILSGGEYFAGTDPEDCIGMTICLRKYSGKAVSVTIVGIVEEEENRLYGMPGLCEELNEPAVCSIVAFAKNTEDLPTIEAEWEALGYDVDLSNYYLKELLGTKLSTPIYLMLAVAIFIAVVAVILIRNTAKGIIQESTQEIGYIRTIGASAGDVRYFYMVQSVVVGLASAAISGLLLGFGCLMINSLLYNGRIVMLSLYLDVKLYDFFFLALICLACFGLMMQLALNRTVKRNVIELINSIEH